MVLAAGFMDLVDTTVVNVTVPSIQHDLHAQYAQIEWIIAAYVLSFAALLILSGRLGDIYGRKRVFSVGMVGFTLASLCCGLAVNPGMLIAARFVQGAAAGLMVTQILAILRVTFPAHERAKAVGIFGAVTGSSAVFGLALGGVIVQWNLFGLHWRPIFLVNVPVGIAALIAGGIVIRESRSPRRPSLDLPGMALALVTVGLLVYPLTEGRTLRWPIWIIAMMAAAVVLFAVFLVYERRRFTRTGSALVEFDVFRSRAFSVGMAMWWLFWIASGGFFFGWTLFLQEGLGWTPMHAGLTAATFAVGVGLGAGTSPDKLVPKFGRNVLVIGAFVNAIGLLLLAYLASHYGPNLASWQLIPVHVLSGLGFGMVIAPTLDLLLGQVPDQEAGAASGLLNTVQQLGMAFGVALFGIVFFTQVGHGAGHSVDTTVPALRTGLSASGLDPARQQDVLTGFRACVQDRANSVDPTIPPAECGTLEASGPAAGVVTQAVARAGADDFADAFRVALFLGTGILVIVGLGFLALPKHARPANSAGSSASASESEPAVPESAQSVRPTVKATEEV